MRNIEIKARVGDLEAAEAVASRLTDAPPSARLSQVDTYFNVPDGRLKLREQDDGCELIFYRRPDARRPRRSDYEILAVNSPAATKRLLGEELGLLAVVSKQRTVYLYGNARIHLDDVAVLGTFVEFEAVMPEGAPDGEGEALVAELMREFSIREGDLVAGSYCDLLRGG